MPDAKEAVDTNETPPGMSFNHIVWAQGLKVAGSVERSDSDAACSQVDQVRRTQGIREECEA